MPFVFDVKMEKLLALNAHRKHMRAIHTLAALLVLVSHATGIDAQTCTNTVQNMTMCSALHNMPTNASAAELAYYDEQMKTVIPSLYTDMGRKYTVNTTSFCTKSLFDYLCAEHASSKAIYGSCISPQLMLCYQDCMRFVACINMINTCVDDGLLASNRECIGAGWPLPIEIGPTPAQTTPTPTTPTTPAQTTTTPAQTTTTPATPALKPTTTTPTQVRIATSAAHIHHLDMRLPVILLMFIAYYMCE
jgi:cell division septation protein DedD